MSCGDDRSERSTSRHSRRIADPSPRRRGAELLFQIIAEREERASIAIATNLSFSEWGTVFPDPRLVAAIVDRVTFNAHILETGTQSYRLRTRPPGIPVSRPRPAMSVSGAPSTARLRTVGSDGCADAWVEPGQMANVPVTFIEDRNGRALVRLPNGSKTSVQYNALTAEPARGHFVPSQDRRTVTIYCSERDWEATNASWSVAAQALLQHWHAQHDASGTSGS